MVDLKRLMEDGESVLLTGPPGCGKTVRVLEIAKQTGHRPIVMRASLCERVDFGGCLIPDHEAGVTKALPLELLKMLKTTEEPTLLFLDDLGQAPMDVQAALMRLFDNGELSPLVTKWGATNRPGDKSGVTALCEPLRSRFSLAFAVPTPGTDDKPDGAVMLGTWADEVTKWCEWAIDQDAPAEVIAWHRSTSGRTLYAWHPHADPGVRMPDYRAWATVIRRWSAGMTDLSTTAAAVGKAVAAEFVAFARLADKLPTPDQIRIDPSGAPVPTDPSALYLVVSSVAQAAEPSWVPQAVTYLERLPRVYGALLGRDIYRRLGAKLSGTKDWIRWFTQNQALFSVGGAK